MKSVMMKHVTRYIMIPTYLINLRVQCCGVVVARAHVADG